MSISKIEQDLLESDLYNSLKELFIGAVTWHAHPEQNDTRYLRDLGMFTCFVQARALYEFFYGSESTTLQPGSTASAHRFAHPWKPRDQEGLYSSYMAKNTPAQKRVFHLVYHRSDFSGGSAGDESDHLKNRVLDFAKDLKRLTGEFGVACVKSEHREAVESALRKALMDSERLAKEEYKISNPL
jgi:hypothetical protein